MASKGESTARKREDEWEAEKFEALNDEFQISNTGEFGDWVEDVLFHSKGGKKKPLG